MGGGAISRPRMSEPSSGDGRREGDGGTAERGARSPDAKKKPAALRALRGMNDVLPAEVGRWHALERIFREQAELFGYGEVRTPYVEATELFVREIGESTDVVEKEMYAFERHGEAMALRPEGTAGAARAYVEHGVHAKEPISRWYYLGPMFRGERPAKGRYRQFYQAGCEVYGDPGPLCDAEMIDFVATFLRAIGIVDFAVHVSSLGGAGTRARYREALRAFLEPRRASLSDDSQRRLDKNPLRILDSKDPRDREAVVGAPSILALLEPDDRAHYDGLLRHLAALGVDVVEDPGLVRGLDYYTRTLFEVRATSADLGAQSALLGGGRYDDMVASLGGPKTPAIGFAMGIERLLTASPLAAAPSGPAVYLAPIVQGPRADEVLAKALTLAKALRAEGHRVELDGRGASPKSMLRRASSLGARFAMLLGEGELERGELTVKDMAAHTQESVPLAPVGGVAAWLRAREAPR